MNSKELNRLLGTYPVMDTRYYKLLRKYYKIEKIMTSLTHLRGIENKEDVHKSFNKCETIFLDTGIFQKFKHDISYEEIRKSRKYIVDSFKKLRPDMCSAYDIPSLLWHSKKTKIERFRWSIENYKIFRKEIKNCINFLGVCAFSNRSIELVSKKIKRSLGDVNFVAVGGLVPLLKMSKENITLGKLAMKIISEFRNKFNSSFLHVYGAGGYRWYPLIKYLNCNSADYAGFLHYSFSKKIFIPGRYPISLSLLMKNIDINKILKECNCPICKRYNLVDLNYDFKKILIHNFYILRNENKIIDKIIKDNNDKELKKYIIKRFVENNNENHKKIVEYTLKLKNY